MKCQACGEENLWLWAVDAPNEDHWACGCGHKPGEPPGFSPHHDREHACEKVTDILLHLVGELAETKFAHVSNGTDGEIVVARVVQEVHHSGFYDQGFILCRLLVALGSDGSEYWKRIGEGVISGKDIRDRCSCGELAASWSNLRPPQCLACRLETMSGPQDRSNDGL